MNDSIAFERWNHFFFFTLPYYKPHADTQRAARLYFQPYRDSSRRQIPLWPHALRNIPTRLHRKKGMLAWTEKKYFVLLVIYQISAFLAPTN